MAIAPAAAIRFNQNFNTFDTLNSYVLRGNGPFDGPTFASLMQSTSDERRAPMAMLRAR